MREMIIKITDGKPDVEVLCNDLFKKEIIEKDISFSTLIGLLSQVVMRDSQPKIRCEYMKPNVIIGHGSDNQKSKYIINQPAHKRYVTYSVGFGTETDNRAFNINFPNAVYGIVVKKGKIVEIEAYMYLEWQDLNTKLFKYAMPNMLSGNLICLGNADKTVNGDLLQALEQIIYAPYSHADLNNIKTFKKTTDYFEYLQDHEIEEKHLYDADKRLRDIF